MLQVYRASAALMQHAGWGAVRDLTPLLLPCLLLELYGSALGSGAGGEEAKTGKKKRKRARAEQDDLAGIGAGSALAAAAQVGWPGSCATVLLGPTFEPCGCISSC